MEDNTTSNKTWNSVNNSYPRKIPEICTGNIKLSLNFFICVVCILGLVGNGTVIWLLGFRIKRNPFTTYILNLAVADFGLLISLPLSLIILCQKFPTYILWISFNILYILSLVFYSIGQLLLTAISVDRCVSVLFPIWYRCHRPPKLSTIVCVFIWVLSSVFNGIPIVLLMSLNWYFEAITYQFIVNTVFCLPFIIISTFILFIRVCFKSQQHRRGKILIVVLLSLLFYLLFAFPLNAVYLIVVYFQFPVNFNYLKECLHLSTSLNSSVNPFIYFLVGRKKRRQSRQSMKVLLQRVFKEEQVPGAEEEHPLETRL
ncbi:mas-related G-protein coupled receptor member H-like [Hemicordylus capensis]|uniref:mas-related G-protein coupled receptor member H-like n=1 Tax=Hemicordylus capensis TaxID=884348 RepID=UPI0023028DC1|nr:mas-related G-protein coupled receptor member H-like [Hemicordylus capensis]